MKKLILILLLLVFLLILAIIRFNPYQNISYIVIDTKKIYVDIAKTQTEQEKGLAIYNSLPQDKGMLFPFETAGYYAFWMKDMKFSIDIIYIRGNKIVDIFKSVPVQKAGEEMPPTVKPKDKADMVLEINAGLSKKYNFRIGDFVTINYQYDNSRN